VLQEKLRPGKLPTRLCCADVNRLPLAANTFDYAILALNGLSELLTKSARRELLQEVSRVLRPEGLFVCTLHNPSLRLETVDGTWHVMSESPRSAAGAFRVSIRAEWVPERTLVRGQQRIELVDPGSSEPSEFSLPSVAEVVDMASAAELELVTSFGDYSGEPFKPRDSRFLIAVFAKAA
jgi:SAM-dependent methyltransferase